MMSRRLRQSIVGLAVMITAPAVAQTIAFRTATLQPLTTEPSALAVGDLNYDQHPDVVVA